MTVSASKSNGNDYVCKNEDGGSTFLVSSLHEETFCHATLLRRSSSPTTGTKFVNSVPPSAATATTLCHTTLLHHSLIDDTVTTATNVPIKPKTSLKNLTRVTTSTTHHNQRRVVWFSHAATSIKAEYNNQSPPFSSGSGSGSVPPLRPPLDHDDVLIADLWYQPEDYKIMESECRRTWELARRQRQQQRDISHPSHHRSPSQQQQRKGRRGRREGVQVQQQQKEQQEEDLCERGLEEDIDDELRYSIGRRQRKSIYIVLDEQHRQQQLTPDTTTNTLRLANVYQEVTLAAQQDAVNRGRSDEQQVMSSVYQIQQQPQEKEQSQQFHFLTNPKREKDTTITTRFVASRHVAE